MSCFRTHVPSPPDAVLFSDASGHWGCGAIWDSHWIQCQWSGTWEDQSIAAKELLPIVLAVAIWGESWSGKQVLARCDNMAAVEVLRSRTSKNTIMMHLLRCLHFLTAMYDIALRAEHIPGVVNNAADAISRNLSQAFQRAAPHADTYPTPIPPPLWELLVTERPDWTSSSWKLKLRGCSIRALPHRPQPPTRQENPLTSSSALDSPSPLCLPPKIN